MTSATVHPPQDQPDKASRTPAPAERSAPPDPSPVGCSDIADLLCDANASNEDIENQCLRARHAADIADRSEQEARRAQAAARTARVAHSSIQAERPQRRAPLPRQWLITFLTVGLDGLACYFAAQALAGSEDSTLVWAALFLAALAGGELALDFYRDRSVRAWQVLAGLLGAFVVVLGGSGSRSWPPSAPAALSRRWPAPGCLLRRRRVSSSSATARSVPPRRHRRGGPGGGRRPPPARPVRPRPPPGRTPLSVIT